MKNEYLFGMVGVAIAATAVGWLLADKRVVLIVASDSSEITVNPPAAQTPARVPAPPPSAPVQVAMVQPTPTPEPAAPTPEPDLVAEPVEAAPQPEPAPAPEKPAMAEVAVDGPSPGEAAAALVAHATALVLDSSPATPAPEKADASSETDGKDSDGKDEEKVEEKKPERPTVVYSGIGRLGHVALTALPKKAGKRGKKKTPATLYPMGQLKFDEVKLANVMKQTDASVMRCYRDAGADSRGKVMAELTVTPEGTVHNAAVSDSTLKNRAVESCVRSMVQDLVFPRGTTSKPARVTYYWDLSRPAS